MMNEYPSGIYLAKVTEINSIYTIEKKCFPSRVAYSKSQLKRLILDDNSTCLVEKNDEIIRAFIIIAYDFDSLIGHIETIDVDPDYQKRGIGLKLLKSAEIDMKLKGIGWSQLEVSEGNSSAIELYRKSGYKVKERIAYYYIFKHYNTRAALRMIKTL
ncbi:MAG: GNAT family N-acetyltransferase [Asgard group archaeon]|nr:GNAT family N-acetyltransferase [Asgard group archaeon]